MSAFVVDTDHIDYLVTAASNIPASAQTSLTVVVPEACVADLVKHVGSSLVRRISADTYVWQADANYNGLGSVLLAENILSVQTRYPDSTRRNLPGPVPLPQPKKYTLRHAGTSDPAQVIRAIECWQYQTCEYPGHDQAPGWLAMDVLYRQAVSRLLEGRDLAWHWDRTRVETAA